MSVKKQIEKLSRCNIGCNWQLEKCWSSSDRDFRRVYISTDVFSPCISRKRRWLVSLSTPCRLWVQPAARNRKTLCRWNSVELHRAETGQLEQMETCCVLRTTEAFQLKHQELLQGWERDGEGDWRQAVIQDSTKTDRKGDIGHWNIPSAGFDGEESFKFLDFEKKQHAWNELVHPERRPTIYEG